MKQNLQIIQTASAAAIGTFWSLAQANITPKFDRLLPFDTSDYAASAVSV